MISGMILPAPSMNMHLTKSLISFKELGFGMIYSMGMHTNALTYSSSQIGSLGVVDSEICEQFNSFLQNIKYTVSHLSQSHFCLYLQFMIYV